MPSDHHHYCTLLSLTPSASPAELKAAYHRALLAAHPDKNPNSKADIAAIQEAYRVLSSLTSEQLKQHARAATRAPRPAQLISLAEFTETESEDTWTHPCRCGAHYTITLADMDAGRHLIPCASCSEVVWVGYEAADDDEEP